jgi:EmrB/QacA subfamily drug resistance transporter
LTGACAGTFLLMLDSTVVTLALPEIRHDLDASSTALQWVMNVYLLTITVLVVTAGRLGDMFGRRRLFLIGLVVFGAGAALSAVSSTEEVLIAGRVVQGVGAAALLPLAIALVAAAFPKPQQPRAYGIWAAVSAVALGLGPIVGGVLVDVSWRLIFWIDLPIVLIGIVIVLGAARESRDEGAGDRIDVPGLVAITLGLTGVVLALVEADAWGWDDVRTLGVLAAGIALLGAFWAIERRVRNPIVDFDLFRNGPYFGATAAAFGIVFAYWTVIFFAPQYLQEQLSYSPTSAGVLILPITAPMIVVSPFSGALIGRFGARTVMTVGMAVATAGLVVLTQLGEDSGYGLLLPGFLGFGVGMGLVYAPMSAAAMAAMPGEKAGIASGVLAMNRILAGAIGLAVTSAVFNALLADTGTATADRAEYASALGDSFYVLVGVAAVCAVLTWAFVRSAPAPASQPPSDQHRVHHRRFHL